MDIALTLAALLIVAAAALAGCWIGTLLTPLLAIFIAWIAIAAFLIGAAILLADDDDHLTRIP